MADLSNLLGDVYGDPEPGPAVAPAPPAAPAWADDRRLDEAFADWTPEPLEPVVAKTSSSAPLDDDLAAALSAALADAPRRPAGAPEAPSFSHIDPVDAPLDPPVVELATLRRVEEPEPDPLDAIVIEPPVAVTESVTKRRSFSLGRRPRATAPAAIPTAPTPPAPAPEPVAEPAWVEPVAAVSSRPWQRSDDDILPATAKRAGGGRARLRVS